ncbi:MAG TPA: hypothetical protein VJN18_24425 [Polyangiaceae bacterium]|nr:hypothetical protein [Polyangiaceae bacterium]
MTHSDDADSINVWLGALRGDVEPAPPEARKRISARLAGAGVALTLASGAAAAGAVARRAWLHSPWLGVVLGVPIGVTLGAAGHASFAPTPAAVVAPAQPVPAAAPVLAALPPPIVAVEAIPKAVEPAPGAPKAHPLEGGPESPGLERELLLLERARTRLAEGDPSATLELLRKHRGTYPSSALEQERAALMVRALMAAGQHEEARKGAAAFAERYPNSVLLPSVERTVEKIP